MADEAITPENERASLLAQIAEKESLFEEQTQNSITHENALQTAKEISRLYARLRKSNQDNPIRTRSGELPASAHISYARNLSALWDSLDSADLSPKTYESITKFSQCAAGVSELRQQLVQVVKKAQEDGSEAARKEAMALIGRIKSQADVSEKEIMQKYEGGTSNFATKLCQGTIDLYGSLVHVTGGSLNAFYPGIKDSLEEPRSDRKPAIKNRITGVAAIDACPITPPQSNEPGAYKNPYPDMSADVQVSVHSYSPDTGLAILSPTGSSLCQQLVLGPDSSPMANSLQIKDAFDKSQGGIITIKVVKRLDEHNNVQLSVFSATLAPTAEKENKSLRWVRKDAKQKPTMMLVTEGGKYTNKALLTEMRLEADVLAAQKLRDALRMTPEQTAELLSPSQAKGFETFRRVALGGNLSLDFQGHLWSSLQSEPAFEGVDAKQLELLAKEYLQNPNPSSITREKPQLYALHQRVQAIFEENTQGKTFKDFMLGELPKEVPLGDGQSTRRIAFNLRREEDTQFSPDQSHILEGIKKDAETFKAYLVNYACMRAMTTDMALPWVKKRNTEEPLRHPRQHPLTGEVLETDAKLGCDFITQKLEEKEQNGDLAPRVRPEDPPFAGFKPEYSYGVASEYTQECLFRSIGELALSQKDKGVTLFNEADLRDAVYKVMVGRDPRYEDVDNMDERLLQRINYIQAEELPLARKAFISHLDDLRAMQGLPRRGQALPKDSKIVITALASVLDNLFDFLKDMNGLEGIAFF